MSPVYPYARQLVGQARPLSSQGDRRLSTSHPVDSRPRRPNGRVTALRIPRANGRAGLCRTLLDGRALGPRVGVSAVAPRPPVGETLEHGERGEAGPEEEAKGDGGLERLAGPAAVTVPAADADGHGDRAGEPEERGDEEEAERDDLEEQLRDDGRDDGDVEEDEDRPDRVEEHEAEGRGRVLVGDVDGCGLRALANESQAWWWRHARCAARRCDAMRQEGGRKRWLRHVP